MMMRRRQKRGVIVSGIWGYKDGDLLNGGKKAQLRGNMAKTRLRKYVAQVDEQDCGVAALSMVLNQHGGSVSLATLREYANTNASGTTALGIVNAAQKLNFETKAARADESVFLNADMPLPFLVHVEKPGGLLHYYVVYGFSKKHIWIADPNIKVGKTKMVREKFNQEWTGVVIFLTPAPDYVPSQNTNGNIGKILSMLIRQKSVIALIVIAALLVTLISLAGSYYLQSVIDMYIPGGMVNALGVISIGLIVSYIVQQILSYGRDYLLVVLGQRIAIDVMLSYVRRLFILPMKFFETRRIGDIISRFGDASAIIDVIASSTLTLFLDAGIVLFIGLGLAIQNTQLFMITFVSLPIYLLIALLFKKLFERMNNETMESSAVMNSSIIESVTGIETIKSLVVEDTFYKKIDREFVDYLKKTFIHQKAILLQTALKSGTQVILSVLILWIGARLVIDNVLSLGQLVMYNALLGYFTEPLLNIINLQANFQEAIVANNRLAEVYAAETEKKDKQTRKIDKVQTICMDDVTYGYQLNGKTLNHLSFKISNGEKVAIVGQTGSGKSTIAKSLVKFIEPDSGHVLINGEKITNIDVSSLRRQIKYIPQSPFIFKGSVFENVTLGCGDDVTVDKIQKALEIAEIRVDIENMAEGINTEISEDKGLSGGQKQRIAIARAVLSDANVLIFDESTSALDPSTENRILDNLLKINKTMIFIAHRVSIAKRADKIFVLKSGRIVECGNHSDLIIQRGPYMQLMKQ